jgi:hypothetical protein
MRLRGLALPEDATFRSWLDVGRQMMSGPPVNLNGVPVSEASTGRLRAALVLAAAACVGAAGALPHVLFAFDIGGRVFFEGAWDESFYALVMSGRISNWNDYPARVLESGLLILSGGPGFWSALLSDVIWPFTVALAAGCLALRIVRGWLLLVPLIFALIFASDIFAINSSVIYPSNSTLSSFLKGLPLEQRRLISDPFVSFLYVYRTPEPQLSLAFFVGYLSVVIGILGKPVLRWRDWMLLACASFICVQIYPFFAVASLMLGGLGGLSLILTRRGAAGCGWLSITAGCALYLLLLVTQTHGGEADATRFASSLPMLAPSILYSLVLLPLFAFVFRNRWRDEAILCFALGCYLIPFVTLDQQVVTGTMIQTLNWERYINYSVVVLATATLLGRVDWQACFPRISSAIAALNGRLIFSAALNLKIGAALILAAAALFLYRLQLQSYRQYAYYNLVTLAYARSVDSFFADNPHSSRRVALDNPSYDAQVIARLGEDRIWFGGYSDLVTSLKVDDMKMRTPETVAVRSSLHREWGYEHAARLGLTRTQLEARLSGEIDNQVCWPEMMFYFSFLECAPYVSDFRLFNPSALKRAVPTISDGYQQYLTEKLEPRARMPDALMLSTAPLPEGEVSALWTQKLVGTTRISTRPNGFAPNLETVVYSYWQAALPR